MVNSEVGGIWTVAEQSNGSIRNASFGLLSLGRKLAGDLKVSLAAVCIGHQVSDAEQLAACGAETVYLVDDPAFSDGSEEAYSYALADLIRRYQPEIVLAAGTSLASSVMPRVAAALGTGLTANCVSLEIDPATRQLVQTRSAYGGNLMASIVCPEKRPQMATVRPQLLKKAAPSGSASGQVVKVDFDAQALTSRSRVLSFVKDITDKVKLEEADIVVCGGRGLGNAAGFQVLAELADALGAALASSRPPVDDGWISYPHQIGQTGKTVSPKVYIACGISGAPQHLAGMQTSDIIVAINEDPKAPIFEIATYGIVGDLFKVAPLLVSKLKESRGT
jgi:electron transfer flavoprotein alpha subunit